MLFKNLYHYYLIKKSGLFNQGYYLLENPDVRKADMDPLWHFMKKGWQEGRNPSEIFNIFSYLQRNPDIRKAKINPLVHYIRHGKDEKRETQPVEQTQNSLIDLSLTEEKNNITNNIANNPPNCPDFIIFPIIDWGFRHQRPQQLAIQFAKKGHRVFYIKAGLHYRPSSAPFIEEIDKNIYTVQLSCEEQPIHFTSTLSDINVIDIISSIRYLKDKMLINSALVKIDLPFWRKAALHLRDSFGWKLIYDCMDLHRGFSNHSYFTEIDEDFLIKESDIVLSTSHFLYDHVKERNKNTLLVPNGTEYSFFNQASNPKRVHEINHLRHPIIGYYGAIADWFDTELVGNLAKRHPEWSFLLIGGTYLADLNPIENLSNVYLLGEKPYQQIPGLLSNFDVCIIPFKNLPLTHATNPVKMYEYLSAGKPIVATRLDEISNYDEYVHLAQTVNEWESAIQKSLKESLNPALVDKRLKFAKDNTWGKQAKKITATINELFPKISIIIITYNNLDYTKLCLESIKRNTSYPNYEIIIVDNASEEDTVKYINNFHIEDKKVKLILNHENFGFAKANNQGAAIAEGEYLIFLNNDTIVTPGWLHKLQTHLLKDTKAGMVGPVTNSIGNEAKIDVDYVNIDFTEINLFAAKRAEEYSGITFPINVLALFCAMISRRLFINLEGLDERYDIGMFEDDDLAEKIKQKGLKLICAEDVFIHHFHGASFNLLDDKKYRNIFLKNKERFERKWETKWEPHKHRH